jgi:hypothetical protein
MYKLMLDYALPLLYPDIAIGRAVYVKRIFGNVFSDNQLSTKGVINTFGVEINADFHVFRTPLPLLMGYRGGYRLSNNTIFHELIFSLSINSALGYDGINPFYNISL